MLSGKDASFCLVGLALGLAGFGCFSTGDKQPVDTPQPEAAASGPRPPADRQPIAPLKIPGPAASTSTTSSSRPANVAQMVAKDQQPRFQPLVGDSRPIDLSQMAAQWPDPTKPIDPPPRLLPPTPPIGPAVSPSAGVVLPVSQAVQLRQLHRLAAERYAAMDSYIARLRRREQTNGKDKPEEVMLFKFRKQPWSVYFKWLEKEGAGREVVYVKGQYESKIHTLLAAGDSLLMPAGKQLALAPDSLLVRSASRHSITEAGIGNIIDSYGEALDAMEHGDRRLGNLTYLGPQKRIEYPTTELPAVERLLPPGAEAALPHGGRRVVMFDPNNGLPVLVLTYDEQAHEVEYYCYDRLQFPVKLDDDDFNPEKLWPKH